MSLIAILTPTTCFFKIYKILFAKTLLSILQFKCPLKVFQKSQLKFGFSFYFNTIVLFCGRFQWICIRSFKIAGTMAKRITPQGNVHNHTTCRLEPCQNNLLFVRQYSHSIKFCHKLTRSFLRWDNVIIHCMITLHAAIPPTVYDSRSWSLFWHFCYFVFTRLLPIQHCTKTT